MAASKFLNSALRALMSQVRIPGGVTVETLAATYTFDDDSPNVGYFDADSSNRNMQLLAEEAAKGWVGFYANVGSSGSLVFLDDAAGTVATVAPGSVVLLGCDGTSWGAKVVSGVGTASSATAPAFTGTTPVAAVNMTALFSGTGQSSAGQVITTTDNQTMTLNQCAGMWFVSATHGPYLILSNTAVTGAPAVLTIYGTAPTTDVGTYKIINGMPPVGTVASHTHTNG